MVAYTLPLREALNESISSGRFEDTKIILYSRRRDNPSVIYKPRVLYASSHVLKTVPYFSDLLSGTFLESESKDFSEPVDESECADDYGYYSDSDLEDDDDVANAGETSKKEDPPRGHLFDPFCFLSDEKEPTHSYGEHKERLETGKIIKIRDVAFITFQAFLLFLYTGSIQFAPYGSKENRKSRSTEIVSVLEDSVPRPSPKSIYRLADKYDVPALKELALESIREDPCDVVEEAFGKFASRYEEIRKIQVQCLASALVRVDEESMKHLRERIEDKVDSFSNGDLDHAVDAVVLLWKLSRESVRPDTVAPSPRTVSPKNLKHVDTALIKSIREGIFFNRKYWTRHSKVPRVLRPFYISSIVAAEHLSYINGVVQLYQGEDEYFDKANDSEDSDYDSSLERHSEPAPEEKYHVKKTLESKPLPVITTGSFSTWRSLFFYLCTNFVQFAPLKSEGASARARKIRENTTLDRPPPCSPKTIYTLAVALDIKPLRDLAFENIRSKLTPSIMVGEFFSSFTSKQGDIMKMQCELLYGQSKNDSITAEGVDYIESMLGGGSSYRASALKLALRKGFVNGVFLRCPNGGCDLHNNTTPYRLLGSSLQCPRHHHFGSHYLECAGCGTSRMDSGSTSCGNCKRPFK